LVLLANGGTTLWMGRETSRFFVAIGKSANDDFLKKKHKVIGKP